MKVSICIPAYKQVKYLGKLLDSVLIQTYTDFEIILTDDTPDDAVLSFIKKHPIYPKINYYKNTPAKGSPGNWNEAIRLAKGEYIKIMHHDDWFTQEDSLEKFVKALDENPSVVFAFCASKIKYANWFKRRINRLTPGDFKEIQQHPARLFKGNRVGGPSATIYRRGPHMFFDEQLVWLVDIDFYISFFTRRATILYIDEPLICTITNAAHSVTTQVEQNIKVEIFEHFYVYDKHKNDFSNDPEYDLQCKNHLKELLKKYKVAGTKEIREAGYTGEIPFEV